MALESLLKNDACVDCWDLGPPPDQILSIPPPPMPVFFANFVNHAAAAANNKTVNNGPCPLMCDWNTGAGVEMNEEIQRAENGSWLFLILIFTAAILILSSILGFLLTKYWQERKSRRSPRKIVYNDRTYESILYPSLKDSPVHWTTMGTNGRVTTSSGPPLPPPRTSLSRRSQGTLAGEFGVLADFDDYDNTRVKVSQPIRIENPRLPPLNFYPSLNRKYPALL